MDSDNSSPRQSTQKEGKDIWINQDLSEEGQPYDPLARRQIEHPTSDCGAFMHLVKSAIGAGVLAMPSAYKMGGIWFGVAGTIAMGGICLHCCFILVNCSRKQCQTSRVPVLDYGGTAEHTFLNGPERLQSWALFAKHFVNISLYCTYYGLASVYLVFVGNQIKQIIECQEATKPETPQNVALYILIFVPVAIVLGQFRTLRSLVPVSTLANILFLVGFLIVFYYVFKTPLPPITDIKPIGSLMEMPFFFSIVVFAMENVGVVIPIENQMENPRSYLGCGILANAMCATLSLYMTVGFLGFWKYGQNTMDSISLNAPAEDVEAIILKSSIMLAVGLSYGLAFFVPTNIVWHNVLKHVHFIKDKYEWIYESVFRLLMVLTTAVFAMVVPKINSIVGIIGALFFTTVGLFCPIVLDTISFWSSGCENVFRIIKNLMILIFYLMIVIAGTYAAIEELLSFDATHSICQ